MMIIFSLTANIRLKRELLKCPRHCQQGLFIDIMKGHTKKGNAPANMAGKAFVLN